MSGAGRAGCTAVFNTALDFALVTAELLYWHINTYNLSLKGIVFWMRVGYSHCKTTLKLIVNLLLRQLSYPVVTQLGCICRPIRTKDETSSWCYIRLGLIIVIRKRKKTECDNCKTVLTLFITRGRWIVVKEVCTTTCYLIKITCFKTNTISYLN